MSKAQKIILAAACAITLAAVLAKSDRTSGRRRTRPSHKTHIGGTRHAHL